MRAALLALALLAGPVVAGDDLDAELRDSGDVIGVLNRCVGYWTYLSEVSTRLGKPAAAEYIRLYGNGARTASMWMQAAKQQADSPDQEARTLGAYAELIDGPAEAELARLRALDEMEDAAALKQANDVCQATLPLVEQIIGELRAQRAKATP